MSGGAQYIERWPETAIEFVIDGGSLVIPLGVSLPLSIPFDCTIESVELLARPGETGSIVVDIWNDTYDNYPPTVVDTITASAQPTIVSASKSVDSTLTDWIKNILAGDKLVFNVDSVALLTGCTIILNVTKG